MKRKKKDPGHGQQDAAANSGVARMKGHGGEVGGRGGRPRPSQLPLLKQSSRVVFSISFKLQIMKKKIPITIRIGHKIVVYYLLLIDRTLM